MNTLFERHSLHNPRLNFFFAAVAALMLVLIGGLGYRQLLQKDDFERMAERQNMRRIIQPGPRGDIFDRHGRLLVGNRARYSAVIYLGEIRDEFRREYWERVRALRLKHQQEGFRQPLRFNSQTLQREARAAVLERYLQQINSILGREETLNVREMDRHFAERLLLPFPLIRDLSPEEQARLREQIAVDSPVQVFTDSARHYPFKDAAAHTLGYVVSTLDVPQEGVPGEDLTTRTFQGKLGRTGLERAFEESLQGESGGEVWLVDPVGFQYQLVEQKPPRKGADLHTSLDMTIQMAAENSLGQRTGAVVVVDIQTGEILALVSKPSYDLNLLSPFIPSTVYEAINEQGAWLNRATQGLYPPGSTFKLITAAALLRNGVVTPDTIIDCGPNFAVGNRLFPEHSRVGLGPINLPTALEKSSNVYFYQTALKLGIRKLADEARMFGLDTPTGLELPFEARGTVVPDPEYKRRRHHSNWVPGDTANVSIGQGDLLTTPLHMALFTASLARGETLTRPTILKIPDNQRETIDHGGGPIALAPSDYQAIIDGMERAVGPGGTGRSARIPGLRIAGKTGTAQIRKDGQPMTLAWFIGFAPVDDPQIALAVMVEGSPDEDTTAGGRTAAPIARAAFEAYFSGQPSGSL